MRGRTRRHLDIWPGYVDVLSTLLMVIIFTLMVFVIGQFFLSQVLSGRERKLAELSQQLASLGDMLAMEKTSNTDLRSTIAQLTQQLAQVTAARDKANQQLADTTAARDRVTAQLAETTAARDKLTAELADTKANRDALAAALAQLKNEAAQAAKAAAEAKAAVDAKLADAYKAIAADQDKVKTLLGDIAVLESLRDELRQKLETSEIATQDLNTKLTTSQGAASDLQAKLAAAQQQIASLTQKLAASQGSAADLQSRLDAAQQQIMALNQQVNTSQSAGDALQKQLGESQSANAALQKQLADSQIANQQLKKQLAEAESAREDLQKQLAASQSASSSLQEQIASQQTAGDKLQQQLTQSQTETEEQKRLRAESELQIEMLNAQLLSLRQQLARLVTALDASEAKAKAQDVQIVDLGKRLNEALANKVEELARYRSEFFGKLREVLGNRPDIQIVGDRFIFQSEVLFDTGSAEIGDEGKHQLAAFADTLKNIAARIPPDIDWILRVDGHTDKRPYQAGNWELSTERAIAVVRFLIDQGIPPNRLVAAGFAEFRPLVQGDTDDAYRHNRRIELKLDQR